MDLEALRLGHLAQLRDAVDDWSAMVTKLDSLKDDARDHLGSRAHKANWSGCNATVTREFIDKTAGEFADAHAQATSVRNILRDTHEELVTYRAQLDEAIERGRRAHLNVSTHHDGSFTVSLSSPPLSSSQATGHLSPTAPLESPKAVEALRDEIQSILDKATASDSTAAEALRVLSDQSPVGFSAAAYKDRDTAAAALHDAERLARLARHPASLTPAQFDQLDAQLSQYATDPLFSERFATTLGARGTLDFWAALNDPDENPSLLRARGAAFGDLQKHLGLTLAAATQSDSRAMTNWQHDMVSLGGQPIKHRASRNYGFQVMGSLMRFGDFDDRFLERYGKALVNTEKERSANGRATQSTWYDRFNPLTTRLNRAGQDSGLDPFTGYLKALSHSPDAATTFFSGTFLTGHEDNPFATPGKATAMSNFDYLFTHRDWPEDRGPDGSPTATGHAYLAQALESATTGHPAGQPPSSALPPHTPAQAALTTDVITAISRDNTLLTDHPGMNKSLGQIACEYLPDISRAMANDKWGHTDSLFPVTGTAAEPTDRAATRFLFTLGQDPDGYAKVEVGQKAYMTNLMDYHLDPDLPPGARYAQHPSDTIRDLAYHSGKVGGTLALGRNEALLSSASAKDQDYTDAMDRAKSAASGAVGTGIGIGATFIASPVGGAAAAGVASTASSMLVEEMFRGQEPHHADDAGLTAAQLWEESKERNIALSQRAADLAAQAHKSRFRHDVTNWARNGTDDGFGDARTDLHAMASDLVEEV